jgi:hypothetical protein
MKEIKRLKKEMLQTPGWTKRKSVEIAVFSAESCMQRHTALESIDKRPQEAVDAVKQWLRTGEKNHLPETAQKAKGTESNLSGGLGVGGEEVYFTMCSARFAIEAARKKTEKKAAKYAAKAIYAAALSKGWEKPRYEGGMVGQYFIVDEAYNQELEHIRAQMQSLY